MTPDHPADACVPLHGQNVADGLSRRTVLRGLGSVLALPMLEAMGRRAATAREPRSATAAAAAGRPGSASPRRLMFVFVPNGVNMDRFKQRQAGALSVTPTLKPLEGFRSQITTLNGLTQHHARANGDGPGDHARSAAVFLTGVRAHKTAGADIRLGVSVDQVAARAIGSQTRLPSLELGCDPGGTAGNCDSGYACAYTNNISWASESTPMPKITNPAAAFDRLFRPADGTVSTEQRTRQWAQRRSVLDHVAEDSRQLQKQLGHADRAKLDEFATAIREIERRVEQAVAHTDDVPPAERPGGVPRNYAEHIRLMYDMQLLAFQMDLTRISTFMIAREGSNRSFRDIGVNDGHHHLSHHGNDQKKLDNIAKIDLFHMEQFAYFLGRLQSVREGDATLLDHCMVVYGSGIADGNRHNHDDLPILLAGGRAAGLPMGRAISYPRNTPLCNLYLSLLERMGVKEQRFGDSTGPLDQLG